MSRCIVVLACLSVTCVGFADDKDKDSVKEKLFAAKVAYDKEMTQVRTTATEWFDKRETAARKAGDKKTLDQLKIDRKAFEEDGELPKSAPAALVQKPVAAKKALETAYIEAVKAYTRVKKDDLAAAVEKELETFRKGGGAAWTARFPPGAYAASYDGGVRATIDLNKDGTFARTRDGKRSPGTVEFADGKLVLKGEEFVEVWTVASGEIKIEHWWPANTYPNGKSQSRGTAARAKN